MFGFLNIYKPKGMTSFDVVAILRRVTHIKQIGHTGTLDPFATGVLPICIGKSTKLIEYLEDDKEYIATVQFGANTDTYDLEGEVTQTFSKTIKKELIEETLKYFEGETEQLPPVYSAIKVNGKKLYEYARQGQQVEIKPRKIFVSKIELLEFDENKQTAKILIACSKGTYIRSIAYDLGQKLNCGGHLIALERTKAGMFKLNNAVRLEEIKSIEVVEKLLINPLEVMPQNRYMLDEKEKELAGHGMPLNIKSDHFLSSNSHPNSDVVFLVCGGKMYGVGMVVDGKIKIKKVFGEC